MIKNKKCQNVEIAVNILTEGITLSKIERQILVQFVGEWIDDCYIDDKESFSKFIDSCWYKITNTKNNAILTKIEKLHKVLQMKQDLEQDFK